MPGEPVLNQGLLRVFVASPLMESVMDSRSPLQRTLAGLALILAAGAPLAASRPMGDGPDVVRRHREVGYTLTAANQADGSILVTFELTGEPTLRRVVRQGQMYSRFEVAGLLESGKQGYPEVLSKQANLVVDPNQEYTAELVDSEVRSFPISHPYLPSRGEILRNQDPARIPYVISEESLKAGAYPADALEHGESFLIRNVSGYNLRFAVTQVDNSAQTAKIYKRLVFRVKPTGRPMAVRDFGPESRKVAPEIFGALQGMFLNAAPATSGEAALAASRAAWPYELGDSGELLVIYTSRDAQAIQPYIEHKRNMGLTVHTQQVATGTNVRTTIQNAYNSNPRLLYVQLVGDWADIKCDTTTSSGETCATDTALGLVSGSDNYLDLIVGRFSAETTAQVTAQVNKAIAYEQNGAQSWMKKGLTMASNEGAGSGDDGESDIQHENIIKDNKLISNGGFTSVATAYDSPSKASLSAATTPINSGLGVINYTGHGIHYGWATTGMNTTAVNNLTNGSATPIIFSVACVVGQYNTQTCFAEAWLRKANGGAVAAVMSTIYQPWLPPMKAQDYMNDLLTGGYNYTSGPGNGTNTDHGKATVGSIVMNAFNLMMGESQDSSSVQTVKSWVIFGDAALRVRPTGTTPSAPVITSHPANVTVSAGQTATFTVGATGATAYQWKKNGLSITGATGPTYTTPAVTSSDNGASFTVTVSNSAGSVTSNAARLTVSSPSTLAIASHPASQSVTSGSSVTFTVGATGGTAPYSYQWYKNGSAIAGATSASYTFNAYSTDNGNKYHAVVRDAASQTVTSNTATLTVGSVPNPGSELMVNGGFETGTTPWVGTTGAINAWSGQPAYEGTRNLWLGGNGRTATESLYQQVTIPSSATSATLSFYLHIDTAETSRSSAYDKCVVTVKNSYGTTLKTLATYSNLNKATGYQLRTFDLSAYKGQTVRVHFYMREDVSLQTSFVVDKVSLQVK